MYNRVQTLRLFLYIDPRKSSWLAAKRGSIVVGFVYVEVHRPNMTKASLSYLSLSLKKKNNPPTYEYKPHSRCHQYCLLKSAFNLK
jgi:hypothetical protein